MHTPAYGCGKKPLLRMLHDNTENAVLAARYKKLVTDYTYGEVKRN